MGTSLEGREAKTRGRAGGAGDLLSKPADEAERALRVKNLLRDPPSPVVAFAPDDQQTYVWRGLVRCTGANDPCGPTGLPTPVIAAA